MLMLIWMQAILAFNFSLRTSFDQATTQVLWTIRSDSAPDECRRVSTKWSHSKSSLRPYNRIYEFCGHSYDRSRWLCLSRELFDSLSVPGLSGRNSADVLEQAKLMYQQRSQDVDSFIKDDISDAARARLAKDHVRWIVVWGDAMNNISTQVTPWRRPAKLWRTNCLNREKCRTNESC